MTPRLYYMTVTSGWKLPRWYCADCNMIFASNGHKCAAPPVKQGRAELEPVFASNVTAIIFRATPPTNLHDVARALIAVDPEGGAIVAANVRFGECFYWTGSMHLGMRLYI